MSLSVAIVGLPNVGKSTLFNALLKKQQALAANYPFATIEPNVGIVAVPDHRLEQLAQTIAGSRDHSVVVGSKEGQSVTISPDVGNETISHTNLPPTVPATITFNDIAGLVAGAHKGEGLGNQFLSHIRECDAIAFVIRAFQDPDVVETGSQNVGADLDVVKQELIFKDLETLESQKAKSKGQNQSAKVKDIIEKLETGFNQGKLAIDTLSTEELTEIRDWWLLTAKPALYVVNVGEEEIRDERLKMKDFTARLGVDKTDVVIVSAKVEAELAQLPEEDQLVYMEELGIEESGISRLAKAAYTKLGLISFLTAGEKECRAWTITRGANAPQAAGVIHTDFEKKFIKADVIHWELFVGLNGWKKAREMGKVRIEGKDYMMQDGDVVEFRIGS